MKVDIKSIRYLSCIHAQSVSKFLLTILVLALLSGDVEYRSSRLAVTTGNQDFTVCLGTRRSLRWRWPPANRRRQPLGRQRLSLSCAISRAHGKLFAVCFFKHTAEKKSKQTAWPLTNSVGGSSPCANSSAHGQHLRFAVSQRLGTRRSLAALPCDKVTRLRRVPSFATRRSLCVCRVPWPRHMAKRTFLGWP